ERGRGHERSRGCPPLRTRSCGQTRRAVARVVLPLQATHEPDFVTRPKRRYTARASLPLRTFLALYRGIRGSRLDSLDDHAAQLRSCMYQYSRAIYRSIKDLIDPYVSRGE